MNQWRLGTQPYIWVIIIAKMQRADLLFGRLIVDAWCKEYMESPFKPMMTKFPAPYMSHQVKLNSKNKPSVWSNNCQYMLQRTHQGLQNWPTVHQSFHTDNFSAHMEIKTDRPLKAFHHPGYLGAIVFFQLSGPVYRQSGLSFTGPCCRARIRPFQQLKQPIHSPCINRTHVGPYHYLRKTAQSDYGKNICFKNYQTFQWKVW